MADNVIAISKQTRNDLIEFWKIPEERISVVYQGCNPQYYKVASDEKKAAVRAKYNLPETYILSVGTIEERKNLMLTLHAMVEGNINEHLVACGRHTEYADRLMSYATSKGISDRVHFFHNVEFDELPAFYQMARTSVYVSLFEGFGIPILEALNSGTPMITAAGGVFPETGGDACIYVGQYDLEDMIEALKATLYNDSVRNDMIARGRSYAHNFEDHRVAENLFKVYQSLL